MSSGVIKAAFKIIALRGRKNKSRNDEIHSTSDKISSTYTVTLLLIFNFFVTKSQYVGDPIACWAPAYFARSWKKYADNYCWVKGTYPLPFDEDIPQDELYREDKTLRYYQWVPLYLFAMCVFFYLPSCLWSWVNSQSGVALSPLIKAAKEYQSTADDKELEAICFCFEKFVNNQLARKHWILQILCVLSNRARGNFMITCYLITKVLYLVSSIGQFFLVSYMLGFNLSSYSLKALYDMSNGNDLAESKFFPRVTMCNFKVRRLGTINDVNLQCVLPINLFNEKIFIFIWIWIIFAIVLQAFSFIRWLFLALSFIDRKRYVHNLLEGVKNKDNLKDFCEYIHKDGALVLKMINSNTNSLVTSDIAKLLYKRKYEEINSNSNNQEAIV
ncbi:DgyrCDS7593 [Dimorphilus gyrociliatus]|uniref:Innexin n=1 Tax=Dimorphilus gyrociliatus TaxID=2664684 RepID=A0A7I8VRM6_9ANNE|nr:DgyrCDS7593 [Dimorphilus gyrociliatus]